MKLGLLARRPARPSPGLLAWISAVWLASRLCTIDAAVASNREDALSLRAEYGVTLALSGRSAGAESVFVSLLSLAPHDGRALNNLGNLALLRGEPSLALGFYDRALTGAPTDGGIRLNRALAHLTRGDSDEARAEAVMALQNLGGISAAARLLGLAGLSEVRAATGSEIYLAPEEVRLLLEAAADEIPIDSLGVDSTGGGLDSLGQAPDSSAIGPDLTPPTPIVTRHATVRATQRVETPRVLYWMR